MRCLRHVLFRCPVNPHRLHFASFLGCFSMSPLSGQVVLLCPGFLQMLQNLVLLHIPLYGAFSLLVLGLPSFSFLHGATKPTSVFPGTSSRSGAPLHKSRLVPFRLRLPSVILSSKPRPSRSFSNGAMTARILEKHN
jgi:hypothetical protein